MEEWINMWQQIMMEKGINVWRLTEKSLRDKLICKGLRKNRWHGNVSRRDSPRTCKVDTSHSPADSWLFSRQSRWHWYRWNKTGLRHVAGLSIITRIVPVKKSLNRTSLPFPRICFQVCIRLSSRWSFRFIRVCLRPISCQPVCWSRYILFPKSLHQSIINETHLPAFDED